MPHRTPRARLVILLFALVGYGSFLAALLAVLLLTAESHALRLFAYAGVAPGVVLSVAACTWLTLVLLRGRR